ncbi:MAG TPA: SelB C-terminal domain-containing protein, partial [Pyrinomonadaceae bacterium]|nr:SelB C-terminal domain-containing protein [Pyrinomonadaceae bacterium]
DTNGGGKIINPYAPKHRRKDIAATVQILRSLMNAERATRLAAFVRVAAKHGVRFSDLAAATGWTDQVLTQAAGDAAKQAAVIESSGVYLSSESFAQLSANVIAELEQHHKREPLARGMLRETLREKLFAHSLPELFGAVISRLEASGEVVAEKDVIRSSGHRIGLTDKDAELSDKIEKLYLDAGVEAPSLDEAMVRAGVPATQRGQARKILQLLIDSGKLVRVQGDMFMHPQIIEGLKTKLQTYAAQHEPDRLIDVPTFKTLAGVSRKYAIPLLEYFDREHFTRRAGDKRVILKTSGLHSPAPRR